jgi:hypothetical protein
MNLHETQLLYSRMALHREILLYLTLQLIIYLSFVLDTFEPNTDAQAEGRTARK